MMPHVSERAQKHLTILGALHIAFNITALLGGIVVFTVLPGVGLLSASAEAFAVLSGIAYLIGGALLAISAPGILAGIGLLQRRSWARVVGLIVGFLELLNLPFGTALGIYTLWVLFDDECASALRSHKPSASETFGREAAAGGAAGAGR